MISNALLLIMGVTVTFLGPVYAQGLIAQRMSGNVFRLRDLSDPATPIGGKTARFQFFKILLICKF